MAMGLSVSAMGLSVSAVGLSVYAVPFFFSAVLKLGRKQLTPFVSFQQGQTQGFTLPPPLHTHCLLTCRML